MRARSAAVLGALVAALLAVLATPADAAVRGRIVGVEAKNGQLKVVFSAVGLSEDQQINPTTVQLSLDGETLKADVQSAAAATPTSSLVRRAVLAIDTSGSMNINNRIGAARQAALAYLASVPADVEVGLVTFSDTAVVRVAPTKNRAAVRNAVQVLRAAGDTALYDAVSRAVTTLGRNGDRSILVLSDGKDEGSRTSLSANITSLRTYKVALNAVLLGDTSAQAALQALSNAAGGRVVSTRAATDLTRAFEQQARASDKDVVVTATIPDRFTGGEAQVSVRALAGGQPVSDTALAVNLVSSSSSRSDPAAFGPRSVKPISGPFKNDAVMYLGLLAVFLGAGGVLAFALNGLNARPETMSGRLRPFVDTALPRRQAKENRSVRDAALGFADEIVKRRGLEEVLGGKLDAGGVPLKASEWLILHVAIALLLPLMVMLLTNVNLALTVVAVFLGVVGPMLYLTVKATLRTRKFLSQLPDTLQLLSGSLSAGYSLPQALDAVVRQGNPPMSDELRKALVEARLGAPVEDAMEDVADRMGSNDFRWVVMAIRIQRQVGGNLAEILATTAATLRERERLRRQVQVLSAEGRLSAYILFGLPIVFALYLTATRPDYLKPLVTDPIGWILLAVMGVLLVVGGLWLKKVVEVEV